MAAYTIYNKYGSVWILHCGHIEYT